MLIFLSDLRHGVRLLRRTPAFTILAVLTIALGVGATTAIFSVADPVLFRPLPFPHADRLVLVGERDADGSLSNLGYPTYLDFAHDATTLERAAVARSTVTPRRSRANIRKWRQVRQAYGNDVS